MALDKFKEHIAEDEKVKTEEVVAEDAKTTDEEFAQVVEAEEKAEDEIVEAKKATKESEDGDEMSDDEEEDEVAEAKATKEEDEMSDEEEPVEETVKEEEMEDDEVEMDETASMTKSELMASAVKMLKASNKEKLMASYKALKAEYDDEGNKVEEAVEQTVANEDVEVMFAGSDLSEEFKAKATTIFEAAVAAKAADKIAEVELSTEKAIAEGVEAVKEELTEKVDSYLDYVVEQWMKDNEIAIEKGLKAELVEDFLGGLKNLFMEHYIDVPEEKVDVLEEQATEIEKLKAQLGEQIEAGVEAKKALDTYVAKEILATVVEGLADTEAEKVAKLSEGVEFVDADQYREKLETIKESYFPKVKATGGNPEDSVSEVAPQLQGNMAAYAQALSRMKK